MWTLAALAPKLWLVAHALAASVLAGAATHNAVLAFQHLRGVPFRPQLKQTYATILAWAYPIAFLLGNGIYPIYRVEVRAAWLDASHPLVVGMFEIKEHWAALGLALLVYYVPACRGVDLKSRDSATRFHHWAGVALGAIVWFALLTGFTVAAHKPV